VTSQGDTVAEVAVLASEEDIVADGSSKVASNVVKSPNPDANGDTVLFDMKSATAPEEDKKRQTLMKLPFALSVLPETTTPWKLPAHCIILSVPF